MLELQSKPCLRDEVDGMLSLLETTGALSISMMDYQDDPILEPLPGETPWWDYMQIHALYEESDSALLAQNLLSNEYPRLTHTLVSLPETDWERVCLEQFLPQQFGKRLWICPSWLTPPEPEQVNLILDPGLAFGTGTHPTTALCLTWLDSAALHTKTLIDYGCGSGILSLAALKLGASHLYAVDIDEQALIATYDNATLNQIPSAALTIAAPETLTTPVDIILANILLGPLMELASRFHQLLKSEGILVVSGIFAHQVDDLISTYHEYFIHDNTTSQDGWSLVVFKKKMGPVA
jgi:ribosomal protein L11 methyltransferase